MKGGEKVEEETKKPCTPVEEAGKGHWKHLLKIIVPRSV